VSKIKRKSPTSAQSTVTHRMVKTGTVLYGFAHYNIDASQRNTEHNVMLVWYHSHHIRKWTLHVM